MKASNRSTQRYVFHRAIYKDVGMALNLRPKLQDNTQDHDKGGIYKLICKTRNKGYIGQTDRIPNTQI